MLIVTLSVENGKNGITPAVSAMSVNTWAHWPMRMPTAQLRLQVTARTITAKANPKINEGVKPTPGHPRWKWAGSFEAYTNALVNRSGARVPTALPRNEARAGGGFLLKLFSTSGAPQLRSDRPPGRAPPGTRGPAG